MNDRKSMHELAAILLKIRETGIEVDHSDRLQFPRSEDESKFIEHALGLAKLVMAEVEPCSICLKPHHDQYPHSATDVLAMLRRATLQERAYIVNKIHKIANRVKGSNAATVIHELAELLDDDGAKRDMNRI